MCSWNTPFLRQSWVVSGVALSLASYTFVVTYPSVLLLQLQAPGSSIPVDDEDGSWLASIMGLTPIIGIMAAPIIVARFGNKANNLTNLVLMNIGWFFIIFAKDFTSLIIGRASQGLSIGLYLATGTILAGEYSSPKYRGLFIAGITTLMSSVPLLLQVLGAFFSWKITATAGLFISLLNFIITIFSPESPTWLIQKGRYEEGMKIFRWLRGIGEEEELIKMIEADMLMKKSVNKKKYFNFKLLKEIFRKKEFYKPIFISLHMNAVFTFGGIYFLHSYSGETIRYIIDAKAKVEIISIYIAIVRLFSSLFSIYIVRKIKRKMLLLMSGTVTTFLYLLISLYAYAKVIYSFEGYYIGICLMILLMIIIAISTLPLTYILSGELFPLEYRGISGAISMILTNILVFICLKTYVYVLANLKLYGAYLFYCILVTYCSVVTYIMLPETKDRTLQEIEEEFRGSSVVPNEETKRQGLLGSDKDDRS